MCRWINVIVVFTVYVYISCFDYLFQLFCAVFVRLRDCVKCLKSATACMYAYAYRPTSYARENRMKSDSEDIEGPKVSQWILFMRTAYIHIYVCIKQTHRQFIILAGECEQTSVKAYVSDRDEYNSLGRQSIRVVAITILFLLLFSKYWASVTIQTKFWGIAYTTLHQLINVRMLITNWNCIFHVTIKGRATVHFKYKEKIRVTHWFGHDSRLTVYALDLSLDVKEFLEHSSD